MHWREIKYRDGNLDRNLNKALRKGIATEVLAAVLAVKQFFYAKYKYCVVRAKTRSLGVRERKRLDGPVKSGNQSAIRSLLDQSRCEIFEAKRMWGLFLRFFARLFRAYGWMNNGTDFSVYLAGLPRLSAIVLEWCERRIISTENMVTMKSCMRGRSLGLDSVHNDLCVSLSKLMAGLLADV